MNGLGRIPRQTKKRKMDAMTQNVGEFVAERNGDTPKPVKQRAGSWQSRRKMVTLYVVLGITTLGMFGGCASHSASATPAVQPPAPMSAPIPTPIPVPAPAAPAAPVEAPAPVEQTDKLPAGTFSNGDYEIPSEMPRGKYKTTGDKQGIFEFCSATVYGDVAGEKILKIESTNDGPAILVVGKDAKRVDLTGDCQWVKQ